MKRLSPRAPVSRASRPDWRTPAGTPPAGSLVGVEHEYRVFGADGRQVDFRALIHSLRWDGLRLDPGDANAYRLRSGLVVTADGLEAETASPPVRTTEGFAGALVDWAGEGRRALEGALGPGYRLEAYSTHLSVALPAEAAGHIASLYALTFGPVFARLVESAGSLGVYVRPRPGRLELCGEYVDGERLGMAALFAVGSVLACAAGEHPPVIAGRLLPGEERFGYRLHRTESFGFDSYAATAAGTLPLAAGGAIEVGTLVRDALQLAARHLGDMGEAQRDALVDEALSGPMGRTGGELSCTEAKAPACSAYGRVLDPVRRPGFRVGPELATWDFTVFRAEAARRAAFIYVPGRGLDEFLDQLEMGQLDRAVEDAVAEGAGPVLGVQGPAAQPGIYRSLGDPLALLPKERPVQAESRGSAAEPGRPGKGVPGRAGKQSPSRIGKVVLVARPTLPAPPPPPVEPAPSPGPPASTPTSKWWLVAVGAVGVGMAAGVYALVAGGDASGPPNEPPAPSPSATVPQASTPAPSVAAGAGGASPTAGLETTTTSLPAPATETAAAANTGTPAAAPSATEPPSATPPPAPTPTSEPTVPGSTLPPATTPTSTATSTATPTPTRTPTPTASPTRVLDPTVTPTPIPTVEPTPTRVLDPTVTPTPPKTPIGIPTPPLD